METISEKIQRNKTITNQRDTNKPNKIKQLLTHGSNFMALSKKSGRIHAYEELSKKTLVGMI